MGGNEFIGYIDTDTEEFDGYIDTDDEERDGYIYSDDEEVGFRYRLKDYDGDIEEEKRKIEERVSKIEDPEKSQALYEELLYALGYDEYFACRPYFKSESYLINMRMYLGPDEDEDIERFIDRILRYTNMQRAPWPCARNVLIVNPNRKFTFLNISKVDASNKIGMDRILKKGKTKLRREYLRTWTEGKDDQKHRFEVVFVELRENRKNEDEDDDNEFITACNRIKAKYFNS